MSEPKKASPPHTFSTHLPRNSLLQSDRRLLYVGMGRDPDSTPSRSTARSGAMTARNPARVSPNCARVVLLRVEDAVILSGAAVIRSLGFGVKTISDGGDAAQTEPY